MLCEDTVHGFQKHFYTKQTFHSFILFFFPARETLGVRDIDRKELEELERQKLEADLFIPLVHPGLPNVRKLAKYLGSLPLPSLAL